MAQASLDYDDTIIAVGFDNHTDAIEFEAEQLALGTFLVEDVEYKGNINELIARSRIKPLYDQIFGGAKHVIFKDYVTNDTIVVPAETARLPFGDKYIQTFYSLLNALNHPSFLYIYKI